MSGEIGHATQSIKDKFDSARNAISEQADKVVDFYREKTMALGREGDMQRVSIGEANKRFTSKWKIMLSGPFIWGMIFPLVFLDLGIEIYQHMAFPLYGIKIVPRSRYIRINRQKLEYLDGLSKIWCMYCSYANGLMHYASVIAAMTELYWCPIQQRKEGGFNPPKHHEHFAKYGDVEDLKEKLETDRTNHKLIG